MAEDPKEKKGSRSKSKKAADSSSSDAKTESAEKKAKKSTAKGKGRAKSRAKKAPAKKAAAKKAPDKKAAAEKAPDEKASAQKAPAEAAPAKEAPPAKKAPKADEPAAELHFMTGFPGFLGHRLLQLLGKTFPEARFVLLVQSHLAAQAEGVLSELNAVVPGLKARCELVRGDITRPNLGIEKARFDALLGEITEVWHLAAIYDLAVAPQVAYRVNVLGTANVLDMCEAVTGLEQLNYISTCYVSGDRTGLILESELDKTQGFKNHYESTKFWAELEVQRRLERLPAVIFRPGIVVGDSKTGETDKYDGPYYFIKFLLRLPDWLPWVNVGKGEAVVNFVPIDFVVDAMVAISQKPEAVGKVFQLADPNPMRARDITALLLKVLGRRPPVASIPDAIVSKALEVRKIRQIMGMPQELLIYFNHMARYDSTNTLELLADTDVRCPHFSTYVRTLIDYLKANPKKEFLDRRAL